MKNITDKEYLTFCSMANLEWQFVDLNNTSDEKAKISGQSSINLKLHELLSPDKFERKYDDGSIEKVYKNIPQMRSVAGVAMNYLEECGQNSGEGNFLKEWEVVYGADNYKLYADYLDKIKEITKIEIDYPSREKVEAAEKTNFYIDVFINVVDGALYLYSGYNSLSKIPSEMDIKKIVKKQIIDNISDVVCKEVEILDYANTIRKKKADRKAMAGNILKSFGKNRKEEILVDVNSYIKLTRKIDFLGNSNFKVVILKNENAKTIVVVFSNFKYVKNETLPEEIDLVQIIVNKIKLNFEKTYNVVFTGYNSGADFGILSNILTDSIGTGKYFYSEKLIDIKDYIDFTEKDNYKNFKSPYEIAMGNTGKSIKECAITGLFFFIKGVVPASYAYFAAISILKASVNCIFEWFENISVKMNYQWLKKNGYIKDLVNPNIKGYITEKIYSNICMTLPVKNGGNIQINLRDAVFLDMTRKSTLTINKMNNNSGFYIETLEDIVGNIYTGKINSIIHITKQADGFYGISNIVIEDSPSLTPEKEQEILKKYDEGLRKIDYMIADMKIVGRLQREWRNLKISGSKNSTYIYVNSSVIEKTNTFPAKIPVYFKKDNAKYLNEHIFLPYITKDGDIGTELRDDYIKNALKDGIRTVIDHHAYAFNSKKELKSQVYEAFKKYDEIRKNSTTSNGTNYNNKIEILPIYFYSKILEKKDKFNKYYKVDNSGKSYTELDFEPNSSEMQYGYNSKTILTRENSAIKIVKNMDGLKFKEILDIILPSINNKKTTIKCDANALEYHLKKMGYVGGKSRSDSPLNYSKNDIDGNGYVQIKCEKKEFNQNFYSNEDENRYGTIKKDGIGQTHMGCDFSYGRENPICCSHPPVYSPVNGEVRESKNGRIVIMNTEITKVFNGKKVVVPYYHIIEHLHELKVAYNSKVPTIIKKGTIIGTLGGTDYRTGNKYAYLQHIHYGIMVNNRYYTGTVSFSSNEKIVKTTEYDRLIDPQEFWDNGSESGSGDYKIEKVKGAD